MAGCPSGVYVPLKTWGLQSPFIEPSEVLRGVDPKIFIQAPDAYKESKPMQIADKIVVRAQSSRIITYSNDPEDAWPGLRKKDKTRVLPHTVRFELNIGQMYKLLHEIPTSNRGQMMQNRSSRGRVE